MEDKADANSERKKIAERILAENPNYALLELRKGPKCKLNCFERKNLIAPLSYPFSLVLDDIRQRIGNLDKNQALFCFVNKTNIVKTDMTVGELYAKYKSPDGFLYVEFSDLDTYG